MAIDALTMLARPALTAGRMILGLSGWMDGGEVSTGAIEHLAEQLDSERIAEIDPESFYIYNFPGSMEISALFRPHCRIANGRVEAYQPPASLFFCSAADNLVLFIGKEPNLNWHDYQDCIFAAAKAVGVETIYFIGSVSGMTPHTREPRFGCSVSDESLREHLAPMGVTFSDYEGPASMITGMLTRAPAHGLKMVSLVAEVPAYVQGRNPRSIEAVLRRLQSLLGVQADADALRPLSDEWEAKLNEVINEKPELAELIQKLEADYDSEVFDTQMGDLKSFLQQQGIRLD